MRSVKLQQEFVLLSLSVVSSWWWIVVYRLLFLFLIISLNCNSVGNVVTCLDSKDFQKNLPAKVIWAVAGKDAELPCDVTPPVPTDSVRMIFWYKDTSGIPLYSLDARGGPLGEASHLAMSDGLGSRSYFITDDQPSKARLRIQNVTMDDEGLFRCRVDFNNSPTRNFQVNLTLIVQPSPPRIFDAEGNEIKNNGTAGPFFEDHELFLSCQVTGGRPRPSLTWWHNNTTLDTVIDSNRDSYTTVNQLVITRVPRSFRKALIECRASSSEIAGDIVRKVPIMVYLKPNKVKIVTPNDLLSIHKSQSVRCESSGSYPPAKLTWLLDGKPIRSAVVTEEETDSFTGSIMLLSVVAEDDGKDLVCRADNPRFPGGSAQDRRQIHVAYPPKVSVKMDPRVNPPLREGSDVVLRCDYLARPSPYSFSWYHDGHLVAYNESGGVLPIDHILTLRNVNKRSQGQYACSAINSEGETYSAPYDLQIQYSPRCKRGYEFTRVGVVNYETIIIDCHVDAIPPVTKFSWTYNTSKGVLPVQGAKMQNTNDVSTLHFTLSSDKIESLACWASNEIGPQLKPCIFYIVPAEIPESPTNCILQNASLDGYEVVCTPGHDGGLHQSFFMEVSDISILSQQLPGVTTTTLSDQGEHSTPPLYRVLGDKPLFRLHSLQSGREYQVIVYAENAKGQSRPVILPVIRFEKDLTTLGIDKTTTSSESSASKQNLTVILVALTASVVLLIVGIVSVSCIIACRKTTPRTTTTNIRRQRNTNKQTTRDESELSEAGFGEGFQRRSAQYRASMYGIQEAEERISRLIEGPDLILSPVSFSQSNAEY